MKSTWSSTSPRPVPPTKAPLWTTSRLWQTPSTAGEAILKVIIETALLNDDQKVLACQAAVEAGADFVKTSTGFNGGGATVEDIALMRRTVGPELGVKASGGVRSLADAQAMIAAGATRIGASSGIAIVKGEQGSSAY